MILPHVITSPVATLSYPRKCVRVECTHCGAFAEFGKEWMHVADFREKHSRCRKGAHNG